MLGVVALGYRRDELKEAVRGQADVEDQHR